MCMLGLRHYAGAYNDCFLRLEMSRMEHSKMSTPNVASSIWTTTIPEWSLAGPLATAAAPNKCVFLKCAFLRAAFEPLTMPKRADTGSMSDTFFRQTSKQVKEE